MYFVESTKLPILCDRPTSLIFSRPIQTINGVVKLPSDIDATSVEGPLVETCTKFATASTFNPIKVISGLDIGNIMGSKSLKVPCLTKPTFL